MRLISTCMLYELAYCLLTVLILLLVLSDFIVSEWILNNKIRFGQLSGCIKVNIHLSNYIMTWTFKQVLIIRTKCFHSQLLVVEASSSLKLKCFNFKKRFSVLQWTLISESKPISLPSPIARNVDDINL